MKASQKQLRCTFLKKLQEELTNKTLPIYYVQNSEDSIRKKDGVFIWIGAQNGYIGNDQCHYECIFNDNTQNILSIEVHFSERKINKKIDDVIKGKKDFRIKDDWIHDNGKRRIVYIKQIPVTQENIENTVINVVRLLNRLDKILGKKLSQIIKEQHGDKVIKQNKQILSPNNNPLSSGKRKRPEEMNFKKNMYTCAHQQVETETKIALERRYNDKDGKLNIVLAERQLRNIKPDFLVRINNKYDIYEVKPYINPIDCINEALGQLLVYSYSLSSNTPKYPVNNLFIVGPTKSSPLTIEFMNHIKKEYGIKKIAYISPAEI